MKTLLGKFAVEAVLILCFWIAAFLDWILFLSLTVLVLGFLFLSIGYLIVSLFSGALNIFFYLVELIGA